MDTKKPDVFRRDSDFLDLSSHTVRQPLSDMTVRLRSGVGSDYEHLDFVKIEYPKQKDSLSEENRQLLVIAIDTVARRSFADAKVFLLALELLKMISSGIAIQRLLNLREELKNNDALGGTNHKQYITAITSIFKKYQSQFKSGGKTKK
jgi:hypothetical protein